MREECEFKYSRYIAFGIALTVFFEALFNTLHIDSWKFFEYICWALGAGVLGAGCKLVQNTDEKAKKMEWVYKQIEKALGKGHETPGLGLHLIYVVLQKIIKFVYPLYNYGFKGRIVMVMLLLTPIYGVLNPVKAANELGKETVNLINEVYELKEEENEEEKLQKEKHQVNEGLENDSQKIKPEQEIEKQETVVENEETHPKPEKYQFILDDADGEYGIPDDIDEMIFFWGIYEEELDELVKKFVVNLIDMKKSNVEVSNLISKDGKTVWDYQNAEKRFENRISETKDISTYEEWSKKAPHSSELDEIIAGRELLGKSRVEDGQGNFEIWWNLANIYQKYATEFEEQTENEEAILYYYSMSIYSCIEALQYDIDSEEKSKILNYMRGRYEDLCYYKSTIPIEYKKRAEQISECLRELDLY